MKILIDLQGCQTASRYRGIGRYSLALAKALVRNRGQHHVVLLANGAFSGELFALRSCFESDIPPRDFVVFDAEWPVAEFDTENAVRARLAELERERLIADIAPDVVLLTSLFEGFVDDAVTSVGRIGVKPLTAVTLYDLIPYLRPDPNWPSHYKPYYDRKIASLKQADLFLSISAYARREAAVAMPELEPRIVNISSACDPCFFPAEVGQERRSEIYENYGINASFIMSAGNIEPRKNFEQILRAFAALPERVRQSRQIVLVGDGDRGIRDSLRHLASELGFTDGQLIISGHVDDQTLLELYRLCELFVFPSKHEGFGLPPLEAMACGAAVIGSAATSVPEVIGREEALFDPASDDSLSDLMLKALTDPRFLASLKADGLVQATKFSWDKTAIAALHAIEAARETQMNSSEVPAGAGSERPRVAMVSPLPPEQTGIADYVAELLPALCEHYEVTVISDQLEVSAGARVAGLDVKPISWFEANASGFSRIVYQIGNSPFHAHMPDLLARYPGVVVLHDFFLSSMTSWMEISGYQKNAFRDSLLSSHGYGALAQFEAEGLHAVKVQWACSFDVVGRSTALILHSQYSRQLISRYYGEQFATKATVTRHHRMLSNGKSRDAARRRLGIAENDFVVCAFGFMHWTKLNHKLLQAWAASSLAPDLSCRLFFVGGRSEPEYADSIDGMIAEIDGGVRISITGFAPRDVFEDFLAATDVAVQLRTLSRGETSGTVLDCLAHGVPVVINANGSMAEYPDDVLVKIPDEFAVSELIHALEKLRTDKEFRHHLAACGRAYITEAHSPAATAKSYVEVIEGVVNSRACRKRSRAVTQFWESLPSLPRCERQVISGALIERLAEARRPAIYLDVSATIRNDLRTGIERVARSLLREMLLAPPQGYQVVPVYLVEEGGRWRVRRASRYLATQPGFTLVPREDDLVLPIKGDCLVALDLFVDGVVAAQKQGLYDYWRAAGAKIGFVVFDLLPITRPQFFPPWAPAGHQAWMKSICSVADLLAPISGHVASEVRRWLRGQSFSRVHTPAVVPFQLGADVEASLPSEGLPDAAEHVLNALVLRPTFLMVGTVEPRKGHLLALRAFAELWRNGVDANLVIVGSEGWKQLPDQDRRTIPEVVRTIRESPELGDRLFWLEGVSDEYLNRIYNVSDCLIAASEDEGFGLPLIEARRYGLPVLARDIPIFREVGGNAVEYFFDDPAAQGLVQAVAQWLERGCARDSRNAADLPWVTWRESANQLIELIMQVKQQSDMSS